MKQNVFSLVNVTKVAAKAAMVSLTACVLTLTSCSNETANYHPTAATGLMADSASQRGLGWHLFTVKASATDINGNNLTANAEVRYDANKVVYVDSEEEMGMPVTATTTDGQSFATNDGNTIVRSESHSASSDVNLNVAGGEFRYGTLGTRLNDSTQVCFAYIADQAFITANLPESFNKEWRSEKVSVVEYYRVLRKAAPEEPIVYRKTLTIDWSDTKGSAYADMLTEKVQGNTVLEKAAHYDVMAAWGEYKPQVSSISVTGTSFRNEDIPGVNAYSTEKDGDVTGLGDGGKYSRKCIRHTTETFSDVFTSTPDANGNTDRPVRCNLDVWVYSYTCTLSDGHPETFEVEFSISSVKNEVDPNTNTYERVIEVKVNGEVVDTMNGKVSLTIG